ncbi:DotU family type IV/VI secretion system protein [Chondromyces apiculatus]|uniref:Putative membrane protein n=1 Tax=Chondromyces apiculatus DSM 436 TaxID=1192034 RepID=A0A017T6Q5_9BACT|nr:DotU family type IV/VI secretion system protein [Chondromyces apiculatus]EYF04687.1 putative membrane protein [Chondromyces apiculatus DSM 436]
METGQIETSIGVFGEEVILWICMLRQSPQRPPPEHVLRQANFLLDELKSSKAAQAIPVQSADDGMFVIAALLDEIAMGLPDLRPLWAQHPLQATRWLTHNAGVEVYDRLTRVHEGPKSVLATYAVVLGIGFLGRFGLPGQNPYAVAQLRRDLTVKLRVDPDRDWMGGTIHPVRADEANIYSSKEPWFRSIWVARGLGVLLALIGATALIISIYGKVAG